MLFSWLNPCDGFLFPPRLWPRLLGTAARDPFMVPVSKHPLFELSWPYRVRFTWFWNRREGGRAQPLKEWHSHWSYDINWLEPIRPKMAEDWISSGPWASLYAHCDTSATKWHAHQHHDSSEANQKWPKSGRWPNSWKSLPLPQNSWNNPPTH